MNKKNLSQFFAVLSIAAILIGCGFWFGWNTGIKVSKSVVVTGATNMGLNNTISNSADFNVFWQAWQKVNDLYLKNPDISNSDKMHGAISGLVQSLKDPYSEFFNPIDNKQFQQNIAGNFGGIGAELGVNTTSQIVVIAPLKDTPAEKAGLKTSDIIVKINASSTDGMNVDQAVNLIRGKEGTPVTLTVFRNNWSATKDFTIIRANIKIPTVDFEMKGDVAHISLHSFNQDADSLSSTMLFKKQQLPMQKESFWTYETTQGDISKSPLIFLDIS